MTKTDRLVSTVNQDERAEIANSQAVARSTRIRLFFFIVFALGLGLFAVLRLANPPGSVLHMQLHSDRTGVAQWFYDLGQGYSEADSITAELHTGENQVTFEFPVGTYRGLRFDPINSDGRVIVESMQWTTSTEIGILGPDKLMPLAFVESVVKNSAGGVEIVPVVGSDDPQTRLDFPAPLQFTHLHSWAVDACTAFAAALAAILLFWLFWQVMAIADMRIVVVAGMSLASVLMLVMALRSPTAISVHPDELSHFPAYQYYLAHLSPPAVDDPATLPSTSVWGYSYLDELDVVYAIAARLTEPFFGTSSNLHVARSFQITLWIALIALALRSREWALVASVVLFSPQVWYVFSYFNADAFPLFLSLVLAGFVGGKGNRLHRYLDTGGKPGIAVWVAAASVGLLLVSKRNYLPLVPAFLLWLAVLHLNVGWRSAALLLAGLLVIGVAAFIERVPSMSTWHVPMLLSGIVAVGGSALFELQRCWSNIALRPVVRRYLAFTLVCVAVALPRIAWDVHVNGLPAEKAQRMSATVEARAAPEFKPSRVAVSAGNPTLALAAHGVPLSNVVFGPRHWLWTSFLSAFGVYGYMNVYAGVGQYIALGVLALAIFVFALLAARQANPEKWLAMTTIVVGASLLTISASMLLSWVDALQAQGRYLFPIFSLLAALLATGADHLPLPLARTVVVAATILSAASFAFVALPHLVVP